MADKSVAAKTEEDNRALASKGVGQVQEIMRFLARAFRPDSISGEPPFSEVELEGVGHILEYCENLLWPAADVLGSATGEVRHG
ncbi:hypothetical protein JCM15519_27600 [Fundidesulfovibrio butyratiphilus]